MIFGYERLDKIKIRHWFKICKPNSDKILKKALYYIKNKRFEDPIVIYDGKLVDGYINYLIAREVGKKWVKVVKIKDECPHCINKCKNACKKKYCRRFKYDKF